MHSGTKPMDRVKALRALRLGEIEVLVGVNLLREGLDLPEVSLVAVLDADREGFLRSVTSLVQTIGRAARLLNAASSRASSANDSRSSSSSQPGAAAIW